jgi:energy-coupling factor transporter ATP-binding protein EcfA2
MQSKSTYLGTIQDVKGTCVSVSLANESLSGLTYVDGEGYRIGQIGSFVKIPIGYIDLFGIVTQVGASAVPDNQILNSPYGNRWITIQIVGEGQRNGKFERGVSQYPTIGDEVHLVSESDLRRIYGQPDKPYFVKVGHIAGAESIPALIDINKLITRHSAVVGTTGSGKSTTVAALLHALSNPSVYPSARIIVLDLHGEYSKALSDRSNIYKINANEKLNEKELFLPFWALNFDELTEICFGGFTNDKDRNVVLERILIEKKNSISKCPKPGVTDDNINVDTPIPFSLNHLWYKLYTETFGTYYKGKTGAAIDNLAYEIDSAGNDIVGDAILGIPPIFKKVKNESQDPEKINYLPDTLSIGRQLQSLGAKLRVPRFDFIFKSGNWLPDENGKVNNDLNVLLQGWIGSEKPITILDLSGVPPSILNLIIGVLLRILYDALFWSRKLAEGGRNRPLLIVMEEAHNYLNDNFSGLASVTVQRIAKEGRKYGIGAMIVSQRPSEINPTILSQCGTFFALRLSNSIDRSHITGAVSDNLEGLTSMLPILRTGEVIILGEAVKLPMRCLVDAPEKNKRPDSCDPIVYDEKPSEDSNNTGGWGVNRIVSEKEYLELIQVWRSQNPISSEIKNLNAMEKITVSSSNIASISYDEVNETLEIEFNDGAFYQYFEVSIQAADDFMKRPDEGSYGKHFARHIKGHYRYSKL